MRARHIIPLNICSGRSKIWNGCRRTYRSVECDRLGRQCMDCDGGRIFFTCTSCHRIGLCYVEFVNTCCSQSGCKRISAEHRSHGRIVPLHIGSNVDQFRSSTAETISGVVHNGCGRKRIDHKIYGIRWTVAAARSTVSRKEGIISNSSQVGVVWVSGMNFISDLSNPSVLKRLRKERKNEFKIIGDAKTF